MRKIILRFQMIYKILLYIAFVSKKKCVYPIVICRKTDVHIKDILRSVVYAMLQYLESSYMAHVRTYMTSEMRTFLCPRILSHIQYIMGAQLSTFYSLYKMHLADIFLY
jgi:hypothetical protein